MPVYEYVCHDCKATFELTLRVADYKGKQPCPICGESNSERRYTPVDIAFRGDGWTPKGNK